MEAQPLLVPLLVHLNHHEVPVSIVEVNLMDIAVLLVPTEYTSITKTIDTVRDVVVQSMDIAVHLVKNPNMAITYTSMA